MTADNKSVGSAFEGSNPPLPKTKASEYRQRGSGKQGQKDKTAVKTGAAGYEADEDRGDDSPNASPGVENPGNQSAFFLESRDSDSHDHGPNRPHQKTQNRIKTKYEPLVFNEQE